MHICVHCRSFFQDTNQVCLSGIPSEPRVALDCLTEAASQKNVVQSQFVDCVNSFFCKGLMINSSSVAAYLKAKYQINGLLKNDEKICGRCCQQLLRHSSFSKWSFQLKTIAKTQTSVA